MMKPAAMSVAKTVHEIKNALLVAQLCTAELRRLCEPHAPEAYGDLQVAIARAARLSMQVLELIRSERAGTQLGARGSCDLPSWLACARRRHARLFEPSVSLVLEATPEHAMVPASPELLEHVLLNLLLNARDVTPCGGTVSLRVDASDDTVRLSVRDSGPGIDAGVEARLFEPFGSSKEPSSHSGIGLYAIREELALVGGDITVSSAAGAGATFVVTLPACR